MKRITQVLLGWIMVIAAAYGASFSCSKPGLTAMEQQICADTNLSGQDENLANEYMQVRSVSSEPERKLLKKGQQDWLANIRDKCKDTDCLRDAYSTRIGELSNLYQERKQARIPKEVIAELSRRSNVSEAELRDTLKDCGGGSRFGLEMCAFASFVEADLKMQKILSGTLASLPVECRSWLQVDQAAWEKSLEGKCSSEPSDGMPGDLKDCEAAATEERTKYLKSVHSCDAHH